MKYGISLVNTVEVGQFVDRARAMERLKAMIRGFGLWNPA